MLGSADSPQPTILGQTMNKKQIIGAIGAFLLIIGVFSPFVRIPILGSINYFHNGRGVGTIILVLAIGSLLSVFGRRYNGLFASGIVSLILLCLTFIQFKFRMAEFKSDLESEFANIPIKGLADTAFQSIQLEWGFGLLVAGSVLDRKSVV